MGLRHICVIKHIQRHMHENVLLILASSPIVPRSASALEELYQAHLPENLFRSLFIDVDQAHSQYFRWKMIKSIKITEDPAVLRILNLR